MAAIPIDASRAADPGLSGPVPARTTGLAATDRFPGELPAGPDHPVLAAAGPGRPGCGRGVVRVRRLHRRNARAAWRLAAQVGIRDVRAGPLPQDKAAAVRWLAAEGHRVLLAGDGINEAPALAAAHTGVAMARAGLDRALDTAGPLPLRWSLLREPGHAVTVPDELARLSPPARTARHRHHQPAAIAAYRDADDHPARLDRIRVGLAFRFRACAAACAAAAGSSICIRSSLERSSCGRGTGPCAARILD